MLAEKCVIKKKWPVNTKRLTGSARRISSPLSSRISRSTPCAAGCWGLCGDRYFAKLDIICHFLYLPEID